jgi:hypothetical protein
MVLIPGAQPRRVSRAKEVSADSEHFLHVLSKQLGLLYFTEESLIRHQPAGDLGATAPNRDESPAMNAMITPKSRIASMFSTKTRRRKVRRMSDRGERHPDKGSTQQAVVADRVATPRLSPLAQATGDPTSPN